MASGTPLIERLLAIDVGVRCGFARFNADGRLEWFQARDLGNRTRMRRAAGTLLREQLPLGCLILEGGGDLAEIWCKEASRLGIPTEIISAETWRRDLLLPREQQGTVKAKQAAHKMAAQVISDRGAAAATRLKTDAAEAILVGYWAALQRQWIS